MNSETIRRSIILGIFSCGCVIIGTGCSMFASDEQAISINELPASVKPLALKEAEGSEITEVEKEFKGTDVIYCISYKKNGVETEVKYSEDGKLVSKERQ